MLDPTILVKLLGLLGLALPIFGTYATRTHVAPGDVGTANDQNQGMDNEEALKAGLQPLQVTFIFDGGGTTLTPGVTLSTPYKMPALTITTWEIEEISDTVVTASYVSVHVAKDSYANYPPTLSDAMVGIGHTKPNLNNVAKNKSDTPDWTTLALAVDDVLKLKLGGVEGGIAFTGTGLNDMTLGAQNCPSDAANRDYRVKIDGTGSPNTFKWCRNGATETWVASTVAITGAEQVLENGVYVKFGATTGHTLNDYWQWAMTAVAGAKIVAVTIKGNRAV